MELAAFIHSNPHFARSVNVERDLDDAELAGAYVPVRRGIEALTRVVDAMRDTHRDRAWSITGAYGSGKSSYAHFVCSLLGPAASPVYRAGLSRLREVNPELARELKTARHRVDAHEKGVLRAVATARREPIAATVARALWRGTTGYWVGPGRRPRVVEEVARLTANPTQATPTHLLDLIAQLQEHASVLLVLDELGKCLEHAAGSENADLYLLQLIAERAANVESSPLFVMTLQHQSFDDYLAIAPDSRKREWTKVQGRFEDVPFVASGDQAFQLIATTLSVTSAPRGFKTRLREWSAGAVATLSDLNLHATLIPNAEVVAAAYPLHPLALLVLPELCARYGQHDRTLFSFLTSNTPASVPQFLNEQSFDGSSLPVLRLDRVFDYFVEAMSTGPASGADPGRWLEIQSRVREARGLAPEAVACLKTVGVLNLVADRAGAKASRRLLEFALGGPAASPAALRKVRSLLELLEREGFVTYVDFADEYRVWQGSDFDVRAAIAAAKDRIQHESFLEQLEKAYALRPVVARRHSQYTGTLRFFESRYATANEASTEPDLRDPTADGVILYVVDALKPKTSVASATADGRPVVVIAADAANQIRTAALDSAAALYVLTTAPALQHDPVARQEVRRRVVFTQDLLNERLAEAFDPGRAGVICWANGKRVRPKGASGLAALLSDLCDHAYVETPRLHNEMLNRRVLTSQGAKTRRELIEAMLEGPHLENLGIVGTGPDWAMYQSVLSASSLHQGAGGFGPPSLESGLHGVWDTIQTFLDNAVEVPRSLGQLYNKLMAPPIGMKEGPIPVLLVAALSVRRDDVSIYQEGTFLPLLSPEVVERLVKAPERFTVKRFELSGVRGDVFKQLQRLLDAEDGSRTSGPGRNATLLSVVKPLIAFARSLPPYTRTTRRLSSHARAVRDALLTATEPDLLLFSRLPQACQLEPFERQRRRQGDPAREFARRLTGAIDELRQAYPTLLDGLRSRLATEFDVAGGDERLREDLRTRALHLVDRVLDRQLRSFLLSATNQELEDREWLEALAMNTAGKPPEGWSDDDLARFELNALELARRFARVEALHYEMRVPTGAEVEARRVTVTHPTGEEVAEVLWVDHEATEALREVAREALERASRLGGSTGEKALLSLLLSDLLPVAASGQPLQEHPATARRRAHGG